MDEQPDRFVEAQGLRTTTRTYAVTVGVALRRPPSIHEYRRYVVAAESPLAASLLATQWAAATCVMPVYASYPEEIQMPDSPTEPTAPLFPEADTDPELSPMVVRCGATIYQHEVGHEQRAWITDEFPNDELCRACHQSVPEPEQHRLFEHAQ